MWPGTIMWNEVTIIAVHLDLLMCQTLKRRTSYIASIPAMCNMRRTTQRTQSGVEFVWVNVSTGTRTRERRPLTSTSSPGWSQSPSPLSPSYTSSSSDTSAKRQFGELILRPNCPGFESFWGDFVSRMDLMPVSVEGDKSGYMNCNTYIVITMRLMSVYFADVAGICWHSLKWRSSTWSSSSTFTWKAVFSSWSTNSKTTLVLTMSSTPSTPSTLSLTSSLWFVLWALKGTRYLSEQFSDLLLHIQIPRRHSKNCTPLVLWNSLLICIIRCWFLFSYFTRAWPTTLRCGLTLNQGDLFAQLNSGHLWNYQGAQVLHHLLILGAKKGHPSSSYV